jgi:AbiU2
MKDKSNLKDPLPDSFETAEEAGAFWDVHSTADYQECLEMNISQLNPKDVLIEGAFEEYDAGMGFLFSDLVDLNTIIYLAEQIIAFPFDLFLSRDDQTFFSVVMHSFSDSAVLTITKLATDQKGDLFTLPRFKNRVRDLIKPEYRDAFDARLKEASFDSETKIMLAKAKDLRNHRIGHTTRDFVAGNIKLFRPSISQLRDLRDALNSLLNSLAFNVEYSMLPIHYDSRALRHHEKTDIEEILDGIARNSFFLNMPERHPGRWTYRRPNLSGDKLKSFNRYRRKFDLPEV